MADPIKVRLKDGDGNILHPETDWSMVRNNPFQITKDSSNNNVLEISNFGYFKFGSKNYGEKYSFGYCVNTSTTGTFPSPDYSVTDTYSPAFVTTVILHRIGTPDIVTNAYYRYSISKGTWESFTPDSDTVYLPRYFN